MVLILLVIRPSISVNSLFSSVPHYLTSLEFYEFQEDQEEIVAKTIVLRTTFSQFISSLSFPSTRRFFLSSSSDRQTIDSFLAQSIQWSSIRSKEKTCPVS